MNIFHKRPLSIIIALMLSTFFIYTSIDNRLTKIILCSFVGLVFVSLFIIALRIKKPLVFQKVAVGCIIATLLFCNVYFDFWFDAYGRIGDGEVFIEGEITDLERVSSYNTKVCLESERVGEYKFSKYKIIFYVSHEEAKVLDVGAKISFNASLSEFQSDDSFDAKQYYYSQGFNCSAENINNISVKEYGKPNLSERLKDYRVTLSRRLIMLTDYEIGSLISALLLGEKELLSSQTRLDFQRSGLSHTLALSGMHLAILALGIEKLLGLFNIGKKKIKGALIVFVFAYMALVGFPISVVRAGIMLILASLFYLIAGSKDTLTNLMLAVLVICLITPYSIHSLSLWLSAFATFGIVVLTELFPEKYEKKRKLYKRFFIWCFYSLLASVFAIGATFFLMAKYFDGFSWISIFINPVFSVLVEIYLYIGSLALIFGGIIPFKPILGPLCNLIGSLLGFTSSLEYGYFSINHPSTKVLITVFTVTFFLFISLKIRHKKIGITLVLLLFASVYASGAVMNYTTLMRDEVLYFNADGTDTVVAKSNGEVMVVETGNNKENSIYAITEKLSYLNITKIDAYTVTNYGASLPDSIDLLLSKIKTDTVYLPYPQNDEEYRIADTLIKDMKDVRCELIFYKNDIELRISDITFVRKYGDLTEGSTVKAAYTLTHLNRAITYLSSGMFEGNTKEKATELMTDSNAIIFGCYGKKYTKLYFLKEEFENIGLFILSGTRIAFNQDTLRYYRAMGTFVVTRPNLYRLYVE